MSASDIRRQDSSPPSPVCSETLSLPESDLEGLSDYSGLSISDEDEKRVRGCSSTESDTELLSDGDFEGITHSMLLSTELQSPDSRPRNDQSTTTSPTTSTSSVTSDPLSTPSPTFRRNRSASTQYNNRVGAGDLAYPTLFKDDLDSPFGLTSLYKTIEEERALVHDQELQDYSVLDVQGISLRPKYDRSVQTESDLSTVIDPRGYSLMCEDAATRSCVSEGTATARDGDRDQSTPLSSTIWADSTVPTTQAEEAAPEACTRPNYDTLSLLAFWQRCGPRWLNRQTFGIFGVVLLGVAAYQVKNASWSSVDTSALFLNTTSVASSDTGSILPPVQASNLKTTHASATESRKMEKAVKLTSNVPQLKQAIPVATDLDLSASPSTTERPALASLPNSVSALISRASSGMASLSTHVSGKSASVDCTPAVAAYAIIAARRGRTKCKESLSNTGTPNEAVQAVSSEVQAVGLFSHAATGLSAIPKRAQKGLSILTHGNLGPSRHGVHTQAVQQQRVKKKQVSRRKGTHVSALQTVDAGRRRSEEDMAKRAAVASPGDVGPNQALQRQIYSPFSRLGAAAFWHPKLQVQEADKAVQAHVAVEPLQDAETQRLLLDSASALTRVSLGNICKQLDHLILPYAQHIMDTITSFDYQEIYKWLQDTMQECYQLIAPYVATVDAYGRRQAQDMEVQVKNVVSTSIVKVDQLYSLAQVCLQGMQAGYAPLARGYTSDAQRALKKAKVTAKRVSEEVIEQAQDQSREAYKQSKSAVKKAQHNAKKLISRYQALHSAAKDQYKKARKAAKKVSIMYLG